MATFDLRTIIRSTITGTYDRAALAKLLWPIAWSGTVDAETRAAEEAGIRALVDEARAALGDNGDASAVEIKDGEIVATVVEAE